MLSTDIQLINFARSCHWYLSDANFIVLNSNASTLNISYEPLVACSVEENPKHIITDSIF